VAVQVARLIPVREDEALSWIEAVSEFDATNRQADDEAR
jgi:antitoxin (DNA-binding transcriptional repressor) of toxin-antitoxin stability system